MCKVLFSRRYLRFCVLMRLHVLSLSVCVCVVALSLCKHDEFVECLRARGCVWGIMHIHVRKAMWCV